MSLKRNARIFYHEMRKYMWALKYRKYVNKENLKIENEKKIIVVSQSAIHGGAPVLAFHIIRCLKMLGFEVAVILLEYGDMTQEYCSENNCFFCLNDFSLKRTTKHLKEKGFNKCLCNSALSGNAAFIMNYCGIEVVSLVHELPGVLFAMNGIGKAKKMVKFSKCIVFPSSVVESEFVRLIDEAKNTERIIRLQGIYLTPNKHVTREEARRAIEKKYGVKLKSSIILNVASISTRKGFDLFLDMAYLLPDIQFIWVGVKHSDYYMDCLRKHGGVKPENLLEVGYVNDVNELFEFYHAADLFALTSREEPMGTVVLESFSAGTPVIAFDKRGGFVDVIKDGINGYLIGQLEASVMADQIDKYLKMTDDERKPIQDKCIDLSNTMNFDNYVQFLLGLFDK